MNGRLQPGGAAGALWTRSLPKIMLGDRATAEDVVQDALAR